MKSKVHHYTPASLTLILAYQTLLTTQHQLPSPAFKSDHNSATAHHKGYHDVITPYQGGLWDHTGTRHHKQRTESRSDAPDTDFLRLLTDRDRAFTKNTNMKENTSPSNIPKSTASTAALHTPSTSNPSPEALSGEIITAENIDGSTYEITFDIPNSISIDLASYSEDERHSSDVLKGDSSVRDVAFNDFTVLKSKRQKQQQSRRRSEQKQRRIDKEKQNASRKRTPEVSELSKKKAHKKHRKRHKRNDSKDSSENNERRRGIRTVEDKPGNKGMVINHNVKNSGDYDKTDAVPLLHGADKSGSADAQGNFFETNGVSNKGKRHEVDRDNERGDENDDAGDDNGSNYDNDGGGGDGGDDGAEALDNGYDYEIRTPPPAIGMFATVRELVMTVKAMYQQQEQDRQRMRQLERRYRLQHTDLQLISVKVTQLAHSINSVETTTGRLHDSHREVKRQVVTLRGHVQRMVREMEGVKKSDEEVLDNLAETTRQCQVISAAQGRLETDHAELSRRVGIIDGDTDSTKGMMTDMQYLLARNAEKHASNEDRIRDIEQNLNGVTGDVHKVEQNLQGVTHALHGVSLRVEGLKSNVTSLNGVLSEVVDNYNALDVELDDISDSMMLMIDDPEVQQMSMDEVHEEQGNRRILHDSQKTKSRKSRHLAHFGYDESGIDYTNREYTSRYNKDEEQFALNNNPSSDEREHGGHRSYSPSTLDPLGDEDGQLTFSTSTPELLGDQGRPLKFSTSTPNVLKEEDFQPVTDIDGASKSDVYNVFGETNSKLSTLFETFVYEALTSHTPPTSVVSDLSSMIEMVTPAPSITAMMKTIESTVQPSEIFSNFGSDAESLEHIPALLSEKEVVPPHATTRATTQEPLSVTHLQPSESFLIQISELTEATPTLQSSTNVNVLEHASHLPGTIPSQRTSTDVTSTSTPSWHHSESASASTSSSKLVASPSVKKNTSSTSAAVPTMTTDSIATFPSKVTAAQNDTGSMAQPTDNLTTAENGASQHGHFISPSSSIDFQIISEVATSVWPRTVAETGKPEAPIPAFETSHYPKHAQHQRSDQPPISTSLAVEEGHTVSGGEVSYHTTLETSSQRVDSATLESRSLLETPPSSSVSSSPIVSMPPYVPEGLDMGIRPTPVVQMDYTAPADILDSPRNTSDQFSDQIRHLETRIRVLEDSMSKMSTNKHSHDAIRALVINETGDVRGDLAKQESILHNQILHFEEEMKKKDLDIQQVQGLAGHTAVMLTQLANQVAAINMGQFLVQLQESMTNFTQNVLTLDQWKVTSEQMVNATIENEARISRVTDTMLETTRAVSKLQDRVSTVHSVGQRWYRNLQGHVIRLNNTIQDVRERLDGLGYSHHAPQTPGGKPPDYNMPREAETWARLDSLNIQLLYNANRLTSLEASMLNRSLVQCRADSESLHQASKLVRLDDGQRELQKQLTLLQEKVRRVDISVFRAHTSLQSQSQKVNTLDKDMLQLKPGVSQLHTLREEVDNLLYHVPKDCQEYFSRGFRASGVYVIYPDKLAHTTKAYCVMDIGRDSNLSTNPGSSSDNNNKRAADEKMERRDDDNDDDRRRSDNEISNDDHRHRHQHRRHDRHDELLKEDNDDRGGWTVIQRRFNGSVNFTRSWSDYSVGFGRADGEHWLGNEAVSRLTSQADYELRVLMKDVFSGVWEARYSHFRVAGRGDNYRLHLGSYQGNASDGMSYSDRMAFSAVDKDVDASSSHCALYNGGAWWYSHCHVSNLNGPYEFGIVWFNRVWQDWVQMKSTILMIRPKWSRKPERLL